MPNSQRSWSESAATSGFHVSPSRVAHHWRHALLGAAAMAAVAAPVAMLLSLLTLMLLAFLANRLSLVAHQLDCEWFSLDVASGCVWTDGGEGCRDWQLQSWFRHPAICVLYVRGTSGESAVLVLPRDCLRARCHRRLYYLLGVSTVGTASGSLSG